MAEPVALKYRAFVSYSHADTAWAKWLHRGLEGFRIDKNLVGRETATGAIPNRGRCHVGRQRVEGRINASCLCAWRKRFGGDTPSQIPSNCQERLKLPQKRVKLKFKERVLQIVHQTLVVIPSVRRSLPFFGH